MEYKKREKDPEITSLPIKIGARVKEYIESMARTTTNKAATDAIHLLMKMEGAALAEIRGVLSSNEWIYIAYLGHMNHCPVELMADKNELARLISEPGNLIALADKYEIDPYELMDKINGLNVLQIFAINRRVQAFWASQGSMPNAEDFKTWAKY